MSQDPTDRRPITLNPEDAAAPSIDVDVDDEGLGGIRPEEVAPPDPDDEGFGNAGPAEIPPLAPDDEGVGSIRPEEAPGPDPDDEGLGSLGTNG